MSAAEWQGIYAKRWSLYYSWITSKRCSSGRLRRVGCDPLMNMIARTFMGVLYTRAAPLQGGSFRLKVRTQRRHGLPLENSLVFYARRAGRS
jgi:hypothetical protein